MPSTLYEPRAGGRRWRVDRDRCIRDPANTHCWLCRRPVDKTLPGTHPYGPTADHEVPLSLGGPELLRDGAVLHLAHNRCNASRSNTVRRPARATHKPPAVLRTSRTW